MYLPLNDFGFMELLGSEFSDLTCLLLLDLGGTLQRSLIWEFAQPRHSLDFVLMIQKSEQMDQAILIV